MSLPTAVLPPKKDELQHFHLKKTWDPYFMNTILLETRTQAGVVSLSFTLFWCSSRVTVFLVTQEKSRILGFWFFKFPTVPNNTHNGRGPWCALKLATGPEIKYIITWLHNYYSNILIKEKRLPPGCWQW